MDKQGEGNDQWKGVKHCMTVMQTNAPHVDAMKNGMDWGYLHMPWYGGNDDNREKGQGWETVETVAGVTSSTATRSPDALSPSR